MNTSTYIIHWKTIVNSFSARGGYSVIDAADKNAARRALRRNLNLIKGEGLRITSSELAPQ